MKKGFRQITYLRRSVGIPFMFSYENFDVMGDCSTAHIVVTLYKMKLPYYFMTASVQYDQFFSIFLLVYTI